MTFTIGLIVPIVLSPYFECSPILWSKILQRNFERKRGWADVAVQRIKLPLGIPASHVRVLISVADTLLPNQLPNNAPMRYHRILQVLGSLSPRWSPGLLAASHLWSESVEGRTLSVSPSLTQSINLKMEVGRRKSPFQDQCSVETI